MRWGTIGVIAAGVAVLLAAFLAMVLSGVGDIPCQDGRWDAVSSRCIPDGHS